jgi:hypothetical protein
MVAAQAPTGWIPTLIYMFSSISQINIFETIAAPFDNSISQINIFETIAAPFDKTLQQ